MSVLSSSHGVPLPPTNEQPDTVDSTTKKRDFEATEDIKLKPLERLPSYASDQETHVGAASGGVPLAASTVQAPDAELDTEQLPPKRRKTTTAEKEAAQREQEERARRRAEEKAKQEQERLRKQAEKQRKEAERDKKAAEREEKRRQAEEEKRIKDEAKRKKDEEREKREKAQLRLNAFFGKASSSTNDQPLKSSAGDDAHEVDQAGSDTVILPKSSQDSDSIYRHDFRPFFVKPFVSLAPWNRFITVKDVEPICKAIDASLESPEAPELEDGLSKAAHLRKLCSSRPRGVQRLRQRALPGVKDIVLRIQGTANNPVDLTHELDSASLLADPLKALMSVPIKVLQYHEDVRPPYRGTFTRLPPQGSALRLGKNPFERSLPDTDYDYDSEAEWEDIAPGDGEDLDSESDDEGGAADDDGEDMDGFLDDTEEDDVRAKRLLIKDEMEPYCSGLWWENARAEPQHDGDPGPEPTFQPKQYRMELLDFTLQLPIDPCPAGFWGSISAAKPAGSQGLVHSMGPPRYAKQDQANTRPPLNQIPVADSNGSAADAALGGSRCARGSQRTLTPEELEIFRSTVQGSSHTKGTLVEVLKKQFPKVPKDVIKDLLSTTAARVGLKEADKRWQIIKAPS